MSLNTDSEWEKVLDDLEEGSIRAASMEASGLWKANSEVKQGILNAFKEGKLTFNDGFVDKHNLLPQQFDVDRGVRVVPGGTSVRRGAYVAQGVIIMPPSYINVGAFIDEKTMIDSHVLVGSCAQIGKNVHLSAGVKIGGVLEPVGLLPVIIEDDVFVGAQATIVEGVQIKKGAVIAPGVILSKAVPVYDCINESILEKGMPIPERAIVIPGSRPVGKKMKWATEQSLQINCALIIKYRDEKSDASLELEGLLR